MLQEKTVTIMSGRNNIVLKKEGPRVHNESKVLFLVRPAGACFKG